MERGHGVKKCNNVPSTLERDGSTYAIDVSAVARAITTGNTTTTNANAVLSQARTAASRDLLTSPDHGPASRRRPQSESMGGSNGGEPTPKRQSLLGPGMDGGLSICRMSSDECDRALLRLMNRYGIAFNMLRDQEFKDLVRGIQSNPSWTPPDPLRMKTTVLQADEEIIRKHVDNTIGPRIKQYGVVQASDGATNRRRPAEVFMLMTDVGCPLEDVLDCTGVPSD